MKLRIIKEYYMKITDSNKLSSLKYIESLGYVRWAAGQKPTDWMPGSSYFKDNRVGYLKLWYTDRWILTFELELHKHEVELNILDKKLNRIL
jgi:hypothetical protein